MKTRMVLVCLSVLGFGYFQAQKLNDKGLYINDNENSAVLFNSALFNGVISETKAGVKSELTVKEGVVEGPATYYYASGKLMETGMFTKGQKDQKWTRYHENGTLSAIAFYQAGKKTGTWLVYDEKGTQRFEMSYNDGHKTGLWKSWDEQGTLLESKDYSQVN
jgi:antitoxin component YwqK of YwqJK toxin-antitoxin module